MMHHAIPTTATPTVIRNPTVVRTAMAAEWVKTEPHSERRRSTKPDRSLLSFLYAEVQ